MRTVKQRVGSWQRAELQRERLGPKTRKDLFRKSLADYLTAAGEHDVAQLFADQA